jgi:hypothetical protein
MHFSTKPSSQNISPADIPTNEFVNHPPPNRFILVPHGLALSVGMTNISRLIESVTSGSHLILTSDVSHFAGYRISGIYGTDFSMRTPMIVFT